MLSHRLVTTPPSELMSASPIAGIFEVSLKITTVLPVRVPVTGERSARAVDGAFGDATVAVGASEQAVKAAIAGTTITDHRARLVRIFMDSSCKGCRERRMTDALDGILAATARSENRVNAVFSSCACRSPNLPA